MHSNDFSLFALFTAGLAAFTSAYTTPVGDTPSGNPIYKPGLNELVPVNQPYSITWDPTTPGTVTLVLLRGPAENAVPLYPIVEKVANTGSYSWTPSAALEPDTTHYGIQLIVDADGSYQYTTQFGIANPGYSSGASSSSTAASSSAVASSAQQSSSSSSPSSSHVSTTHTSTVTLPLASTPANSTTAAAGAGPSALYTTEVVTAFTTYCPAPTQVAVGNRTYTVSAATTLTVTDCPCTITRPVPRAASSSSVAAASASASASSSATAMATGSGAVSGPVLQPTRSMSVPASLRTSTVTSGVGAATGAAASATQSRPAVATVNAAGRVGVGMGLVAGVGALVAVL